MKNTKPTHAFHYYTFYRTQKKRTSEKQLTTTKMIFVVVSFILFLTCRCTFFVFSVVVAYFLSLSVARTFFYTSFLYRRDASQRVRRMTCTLGIMTLFDRYLALLFLAHSLIYSGLFILCTLFDPVPQFTLLPTSFITIHDRHIPLLRKFRISLIAKGKLNQGNSDYKVLIIFRLHGWYL